MWFSIAVTGYFLLAVVVILDKLIVSKSEVKPAIYTFYSTIFMLATPLVFLFVDFEWLKGADWLWALVSGVSFGFGLWTLYLAVKKGEASHISPFNGAAITFFIYLLSAFFLSEKLTSVQLGGMAILIFASLLLSFEKTRSHSGFHTGFLWALLSGLLFAFSHVSAKYLYAVYPFWTGFLWSRTMIGLVGLFLLFFPAVRRSLSKKEKSQPKTYARRHAGFIVISNKVLSVLANLFIQYAMALGSVTLVGAMSGLQFAFMFALIYLLTKFLPKVFKEYFTRREIAIEVIAILLVALGSVFFVL